MNCILLLRYPGRSKVLGHFLEKATAGDLYHSEFFTGILQENGLSMHENAASNMRWAMEQLLPGAVPPQEERDLRSPPQYPPPVPPSSAETKAKEEAKAEADATGPLDLGDLF